jgi:glycine betaine/proline transport system substrate-binding protein
MQIRRLLFLSLALLILTAVFGCSDDAPATPQPTAQHPVEKGTIRIGYPDLIENKAVVGVWQILLEKQGYKVETVRLDVAEVYAGLAKGELDLFFDAWLPATHREYWQKHRAQIEDIGIWFSPVKLGLAVPSFVDVNSIADVIENSSLFDRTGDGIGDIIGVEPGAPIMPMALSVRNFPLLPHGSESS